MPPQAQLTSAPGRRVRIRDRNHARELARGIALGTLFQSGGTVEGFADWLFISRRTFNGANPAQQASVYANQFLRDQRRGVDSDVVCRSRAEEREKFYRQAEASLKAEDAALGLLWARTIDGPGIVLAIAELFLGRGQHFADSAEGKALPDPPSWALEGLLKLLGEFGGPEKLLHQWEWTQASAEEDFRKMAPILDGQLTRICDATFQSDLRSEWDLRCVARAASALARISRVRITLRTLLTKVQMVEQIEGSSSDAAGSGPAPARRRREV